MLPINHKIREIIINHEIYEFNKILDEQKQEYKKLSDKTNININMFDSVKIFINGEEDKKQSRFATASLKNDCKTMREEIEKIFNNKI